MCKALKRWRFCRNVLGLSFGKCVQAALFGKEVFKVG